MYAETNMIYSVENNKEGINVITFPTNTVGRYFAIKITKCDDGTPASYIYPRCKEIALSGERLSENYASWSGIPTNITAGKDTAPYWMNGIPTNDPSNIINGIAPVSTSFFNGNSTTTNLSGGFAAFTDGYFNDTYVSGNYTAATYMNDNTYMDIV